MKRIISFVLSALILISVFSSVLNISAREVHKGIITIGTTSANTGDIISVPIDISENPGIMAITISITYDSNSLEYVEFLKGKVIKDYDTIVDHPDKNLIRLVAAENTDRTRNGTILTLRFKVKDNAMWSFSKIDIDYSSGDFCNWDLDKIMPKIISGGVDIAYNGTNCPHEEYSEWKTVAEPTCDCEGIKERICKKCNHVDSLKIEKSNHTYPEEWTIETAATKDKPGTMVRYCLTCNKFVDRIEYTLEDSQEGDFENVIGNEIPKNEIIEENFKEQYPNQEFTPINPIKTPVLPSENKDSSENETNQEKDTLTKPQTVPDLTPSENEGSDKKTEITEITAKDVFTAFFNGFFSKGNLKFTESVISTEKIAAIEAKITEVFSNYEIIEESFETSFIILILLILI